MECLSVTHLALMFNLNVHTLEFTVLFPLITVDVVFHISHRLSTLCQEETTALYYCIRTSGFIVNLLHLRRGVNSEAARIIRQTFFGLNKVFHSTEVAAQSNTTEDILDLSSDVKKTTEKKNNRPPYCFCGVIQVSTSPDIHIQLETASFRPCFKLKSLLISSDEVHSRTFRNANVHWLSHFCWTLRLKTQWKGPISFQI